MDQSEYISKISLVPEDGEYKAFASSRMQLAWLAHSRPDIMYEVSQFTQVTSERFEEDRRGIVR